MGWTWPWKTWTPKIKGLISADLLYAYLHKLHPKATIILEDKEYRIPAEPDDIIWKCSPHHLTWLKARRDCEDFSRIALGWLSEKAMGDLTVFRTSVFPADLNETGHSILSVWDGKGLVFGEPQTGRMIKISEESRVCRLIA